MIIRDATVEDLVAIAKLLADDPLGAPREAPGDPAYAEALRAIDANPSTRFLVMEVDAVVIGCLQLDVIASLARRGTTRAVIDSVRINSALRGRGYGEALVRESIRLAEASGVGLVELSSNLVRKDAHRFYQRLGFIGDRLGMKLDISGSAPPPSAAGPIATN